jgi:hypothetical protein
MFYQALFQNKKLLDTFFQCINNTSQHLQNFKIHMQIIIHNIKIHSKWNFDGVVSKVQLELL